MTHSNPVQDSPANDANASLAGLSREELLALAYRRKLQQYAKEHLTLRLYQANPGPQDEFQRSLKRLRFLFGGNRTGKSVAGGVEAVRFSLGKHPFRPGLKASSGWVISPTFEVQRDSAQEKVLQYLPTSAGAWMAEEPRLVWRDRARGYLDRIELVTFGPGGARVPAVITFKSAEQGRKAFQAVSIGWAWFDEEVELDIFVETMMRVLDQKGDVWGTMTPLVGDLYDAVMDGDLSRDSELQTWHMQWDDNKYLDEGEKKRMFALIPESEREMRVYGRYVPREGRVFPQFQDNPHVIPLVRPDENQKHQAGFDYGLRLPSAYIAGFINAEGNVIIYDEWYEREKTLDQVAAAIKERKGKRIIADPALWNRESSQKSIAGELSQRGVHLSAAPRGEGLWKARMDRIRECLGTRGADGEWVRKPMLYVCNNCTGLIRELRKLRWKESRSGTQHDDVQGDDHAIDALGYLLEDWAYLLGKPGAQQVNRYGKRYKPRNKVTGY